MIGFTKLQIECTPEFAHILYELKSSVLISTYQAGRVIAFGSLDGKKLHQIPFAYKKPMGIAVQDKKIALATLDEIHFLSSKGSIQESKLTNENDYDAFYIHRSTYNTSLLDIHDIDFGKGALWGVNTAFSCICKFDINYSFVPKWVPDFISELVPEDRCHLNGMAMADGFPKYATALSQTNEKGGWRKDIMHTGVLMEVPGGEIILENLAMPHSPILINGELYVLESGNGNLLKVDIENKSSEIVYEFNKFLRGMSYKDGYLFIGISKIRESSRTFNVLNVKNNSDNAGVIVFDLAAKEIKTELLYTSTVEEIFDVQLLENALKPALISHLDDRRKDVITCEANTFWKKRISPS